MILLALGNWGCVKHIPYTDDQVTRFHSRSENIRLTFRTDKGEQVAFYLPPLQHPAKPPARLVILYPGIHSVALDWLDHIQLGDDPETGYLLIDYPGRGFCEGRMHPEENYKNSEGALKSLAEHFALDELQAEISLLGYSFGTGAALQFALRTDVKNIVLVAPFTTLTLAVAEQSKLLAFLMPAEVDNQQQITTLLAGPSPPGITIVHGKNDTSLPVKMGRQLATIDPQSIVYYEIPDGDHVSVLSSQRDLIFNTVLGKVPDAYSLYFDPSSLHLK